MSADLTPAQALLVFGLLARHGRCAQAVLVPKAKKVDVEALRGAGLVEVGKDGRRLLLSLTDSGWAWADHHLATELPAAHATLQGWLTRLDEHLRKRRRKLADFIGAVPEDDHVASPRANAKHPDPVRASRRPTGAAPTRSGRAPSKPVLRKMIEAAFLAITDGRRNQSVRLADLRTRLDSLDRGTVDRGLGRILAGDKTMTLMRHDDPRQIRAADRAAAFAPAGEPYHLLWMSA